MQVCAAAAAASGESFGQHPHDGVERFARQTSERVRAPNHFEQPVFRPFFRSNCRDNLLRENIKRLFGNLQMIELAAPHRVEQRRAFNQFVARERKDSTFRKAADRMVRSANPLQQRRNRARRSDLNYEIDRANVDTKFQRGCGHQRTQLA